MGCFDVVPCGFPATDLYDFYKQKSASRKTQECVTNIFI